MATDQMTYQQLDDVLLSLGFARQRIEPKWLRYEHSASQTEIILVDKKPNEFVRASDAWSAREHLIHKGLISEDEFNRRLGREGPRAETASTPAETS